MKVDTILDLVDGIKANAIDEGVKLAWINEAEGRVECEIHKKKSKNIVLLTSGNDDLSVSGPYARIYVLYLIAMIAFAKGEYELYERTFVEYENAFSEYAKYYIRNR